MSGPLKGSLAATYLAGRGITDLRDTGALKFHPNCYYRGQGEDQTETWPAMIAAVTDLEGKGLVEKVAGDLDGRRRAATLTKAGEAFEERISERLRAQLARSYRVGGLDGVAGVRQILSALAGGRMKSGGA